MKTLFNFMLIALFSVSISGVQAQARKPNQSRKITKSSEAEVKVYKVVPGDIRGTSPRKVGSSNVAKRATNASTIKKNSWVKGHGKLPSLTPAKDVMPDPKSTLQHLVLSAKKPYKGNLGYLTSGEVRFMDVENNYMIWDDLKPNEQIDKSYLKVYLELEKGKKYLVDFNIACNGSTTFKFSTTSGSHETTYDGGSHHLVSILEAEASGKTSIMLSAYKDGWTFYQLEVTRLD